VENSGGNLDSTSQAGGGSASLAGRYATALFGLARDNNQIESVAQSLESLSRALAESADLKRLVSSPLISRDDAAKVVAALAPTLALDPLTTKFVGVLARNGRLRELPAVITQVRRLVANNRGETTAHVTTAHPLDDQQRAALATQLKARAKRDVIIDAQVDPSILGGIVVRLGSQMIDASIRTKLNTLATAMKG